eukprot:6293064-Prymnesium_polylepis.1
MPLPCVRGELVALRREVVQRARVLAPRHALVHARALAREHDRVARPVLARPVAEVVERLDGALEERAVGLAQLHD